MTGSLEATRIKTLGEMLVTHLKDIQESDIAWCSLVTKGGARLDCVDSSGNNSLHHAARRGYTSLVALMLAEKPALDLANHDGETPLMLAAAIVNLPLVEMMIEAGADATLTDGSDKTARHHAEAATRDDTPNSKNLTIALLKEIETVGLAGRRERINMARVLKEGLVIKKAMTPMKPPKFR